MPIKNLFFTEEELDYMVSRATLNAQVGMSMNARALQFSKRFRRTVSVYFLRSLYDGRGVTKQLPQVRMGPKKLQSADE